MAAVDMVSGLHAYFQIIRRTKARCRCQLLHGHGRVTLQAASQCPATLDIVINSTPAAAAPAHANLSHITGCPILLGPLSFCHFLGF